MASVKEGCESIIVIKQPISVIKQPISDHTDSSLESTVGLRTYIEVRERLELRIKLVEGSVSILRRQSPERAVPMLINKAKKTENFSEFLALLWFMVLRFLTLFKTKDSREVCYEVPRQKRSHT